MASVIASYWQIFRVIFVLFSLYLMGDAFYRWDGFRYYASFLEFLPNVALVAIIWSIVAVFIALLVWLPVRAVEWFCQRRRWKVTVEHLLLFICISVFLGAAVWLTKRFIWESTPTTLELKLIALSGVIFAAIFLTWLFRNKAAGVIRERITPLVWLFGILVLLSVPLAAFQMGGGQTDRVVSQKSSEPPKRPNIILVTFDTLTARDMSVYGYNRPTTPFISEWAKASSLFTGLQAGSNFTASTVASLMTGKRVWTHQAFHIGGSKPVRSDIENLPLVLENNGYYNMAFVVNPFASVGKMGISGNFEIAPFPAEFQEPAHLWGTIAKKLYELFGNKLRLYNWSVKNNFILGYFLSKITRDFSKTEMPPEKAFNKFLEVIDNNPPAPVFAWIHLFPPHYLYLPPEPYMGMFDSSSEMRTYKSQEKVGADLHFPQEIQPAVDTLRARYDEFIRYCDKQFENFIAQLTTVNKLKNTVIILSSDHGESFEHNYLGHGGPHLYEQMTYIPLIIKEPNQREGRTINDLVGQIDIAPTILDLAGIPAPSWMEGRSLAPLMRGKGLSSRPVFSMNFQKNSSLGYQIARGTVAVWEGDYKLIYYLDEKKSLLFNLKEDPDELNNLFDKESVKGQRLLTLIQDNLKKANEKIMRER